MGLLRIRRAFRIRLDQSITSIIFPTAWRHVPNREIHARHIRITDVLNVKTGLFPNAAYTDQIHFFSPAIVVEFRGKN